MRFMDIVLSLFNKIIQSNSNLLGQGEAGEKGERGMDGHAGMKVK